MQKKSVNSDYQAVIKKEADKLYYELCLHREKWSKLNKGFWVWVEGTLMPTKHAARIGRHKANIDEAIYSSVNAFQNKNC